MTSDGTPWRPLVHALDIAKAIRCVLRADREIVHSLVVNVGSDENNYTVREIAETVGKEFPGCSVSFGPPSADNRSYRVAFDKIHELFPEFKTEWNVADGAAQLHNVFRSIDMDAATFYGRGHTRLKQIEYLLKTDQLDAQLFWRDRVEVHLDRGRRRDDRRPRTTHRRSRLLLAVVLHHRIR